MAVHNHGPEEGPGLGCNELRLSDGTPRGACIVTAEELADIRTPEPALDADAPAREILFAFLASIPAVRVRAASYARSAVRDVDLSVLISAARDLGIFGPTQLLELVKHSITSSLNPLGAEEAWAEHSIGFVWDSEEHRYGEYRAFLAGYEMRGKQPA